MRVDSSVEFDPRESPPILTIIVTQAKYWRWQPGSTGTTSDIHKYSERIIQCTWLLVDSHLSISLSFLRLSDLTQSYGRTKSFVTMCCFFNVAIEGVSLKDNSKGFLGFRRVFHLQRVCLGGFVF